MINCKGRYLNIYDLPAGNLVLELTPEGREEIHNFDRQVVTGNGIFSCLFEDYLGNGWELLAPEEVGALTNCETIISFDVTRDDVNNNIVRIGDVWWHERYQIEDIIEVLLQNGKAELRIASIP